MGVPEPKYVKDPHNTLLVQKKYSKEVDALDLLEDGNANKLTQRNCCCVCRNSSSSPCFDVTPRCWLALFNWHSCRRGGATHAYWTGTALDLLAPLAWRLEFDGRAAGVH